MSLRKRSCRPVGNCRDCWWLLIENCDIREVSVTKDLYARTLNKWLLIVIPGRQFRLTFSMYTSEKIHSKVWCWWYKPTSPSTEIILNSTQTSQILRTRTESTDKEKFPKSDLWPYSRTQSFYHTLLRRYSSLLAMPLWRIFSHSDTFSTAQKKALVQSITPFYTRSGLPAFYVNVVFIPVEPSSFYIGNQPVRDMVRIAIEHIAIHRPKLDGIENNARARMCVEIDQVVTFVYANLLAYRKDEWLIE